MLTFGDTGVPVTAYLAQSNPKIIHKERRALPKLPGSRSGRSARARQDLAAEQADVVEIFDVVNMEVDGVEARGGKLLQVGENVCGDPDNPIAEHPRPRISQYRRAPPRRRRRRS